MKTSLFAHRVAAVLLCVAGLVIPQEIRGEEQTVERASVRDTVIVPYDAKKPLREQKPDRLYLPYERFLELWEAAKATRAGVKPDPAPRPFALTSGIYEAKLEERRVMVSATIDFTTYEESWIRVPMKFGARLSASTLDGKPVALDNDELLVEQPGRHALAVQFEIPLASGAQAFEWAVPRTAATRVRLILPEARWSATLNPESALIEQIDGGKKVVTAALGPVEQISVTVVESAMVARVVEPAVARITTALAVGRGFERATAEVQFQFPGAQQDKFAVMLYPPGAVFAGMEAPGLRSWQLRDNGDEQILEVTLAEPAREDYLLKVTTERVQPRTLPVEQTALWFGAGAKRREHIQEVYAGEGVEILPLAAGGLRQIERNLKPSGEWKPVGAWAGEESLKYRVLAAEAKREARVDYVYQVNRRKVELIASMQLSAKGDAMFEAAMQVPSGFDVHAVDSVRLLDWWLESDTRRLRVRFKGETPETTPLVVYLVRLYESAPEGLEIRPLVLDGFRKVTGEAVIAAHRGVDAALKLAGEAGRESPREIDAANAAADFKILPPMERKRGFAITTQAFSGEVTLKSLPVKSDVEWVMHAQTHEAWVAMSLKAQFTLRQGSFDRASFALPESLPEARITGSEVREARSRVEDGKRIYDVNFQDDVYDRVDFTVDLEAPMGAGGLKLPVPEFRGMNFATGYVVADNASEYEMKLKSDGTEPMPLKDLPWQPSTTKNAAVYRLQPSWEVTVGVERLEKSASRSAYCAWAEMTTALRRDGTEWHRAVWRLQNRSLQFLPVKLPKGAEWMSARVAGQGVRADSGEVDGVKVLLVPLIKTKPGDVSYDVEVVWRQMGRPLEQRDVRNFDDAELVGLTVEQTFWNVWLPEDRELTDTDGNMQAVLEVGREVEKGRSVVEELKALNKLMKSENVTPEVLANAQFNFDLYCRTLEQQVVENRSKLSSSRQIRVDSSAALKELQSKVSQVDEGNTGNWAALGQLRDENARIQIDNGKRQGELAQRGAQGLAYRLQSEAQTFGGVVANPQGADVINGPVSANGTVDPRWLEKDGTNKAQQRVESPVEAGKQNLYVNDNIVLAQVEQKLAQKTVKEGAKGGEEGKKGAAGGPIATLAPTDRKNDAANVDAELKERTFNTARGNRLQLQEQTQVQRPVPQMDAMAPAAKPVTATGAVPPSTPVQAPVPTTSPAPVQSAMPLAAAPTPPANKTGLENQGRISLDVAFPMEGKVYHFQKLKAHAALKVTFADPTANRVWIHLALFAGAGILLALAGRQFGKRVPVTR